MSTPENPPAFPVLTHGLPEGMTLRDYFAAEANEEDVQRHRRIEGRDALRTWEEAKFHYADAMLAARNRAGEEGR